MKKRALAELKKTIPVLIAGLIYYIWLCVTDIYIPCIFRKITGFKCPGCGITRMILSFVKLDFVDAFSANPFLFVVLPVMIVIYINNKIFYIRSGKQKEHGKFYKTMETLLLVAVVLFGIVRNIL